MVCMVQNSRPRKLNCSKVLYGRDTSLLKILDTLRIKPGYISTPIDVYLELYRVFDSVLQPASTHIFYGDVRTKIYVQ